MVKLENSHHAKEQQYFLISLLAFPILNLYLAVNIEVNIYYLIISNNFLFN